jgi:glycosyltransferase 2 family protein
MPKTGLPQGAEHPSAESKEAAAVAAPRTSGMISMRRINLILLGIAGVALVLMLRKIDWLRLLHSFSQVGPYWPLLFLPYGLVCFFWTVSWRALLVGPVAPPPLRRLFFMRLAGDALNQLTPTASLGGEPYKAMRLHADGMDWSDATTSLVIQKALMVLSLVLYILVCFTLLPAVLPGISHRLALFCSLGTLLLAAAGFTFLSLQRRNPCVSFLRILKRLRICPPLLAQREPELATLDASLSGFYRDHAGAVGTAFFFFFLGWLTHAVEVYLIFWLLGHPISFTVALCLDALAQLVAGLGFMIPASLGVQDGGNVLLSLGFNLGATMGAGFSILRRFREAFWLLLGLLAFAREK